MEQNSQQLLDTLKDRDQKVAKLMMWEVIFVHLYICCSLPHLVIIVLLCSAYYVVTMASEQ